MNLKAISEESLQILKQILTDEVCDFNDKHDKNGRFAKKNGGGGSGKGSKAKKEKIKNFIDKYHNVGKTPDGYVNNIHTQKLKKELMSKSNRKIRNAMKMNSPGRYEYEFENLPPMAQHSTKDTYDAIESAMCGAGCSDAEDTKKLLKELTNGKFDNWNVRSNQSLINKFKELDNKGIAVNIDDVYEEDDKIIATVSASAGDGVTTFNVDVPIENDDDWEPHDIDKYGLTTDYIKFSDVRARKRQIKNKAARG